MTTSAKTATDIISVAFDILGITAEGESITAPQASTALGALNDLLQSFPLEGINMPYANMAANDYMVIPPSQFLAIEYLLAYELAPRFGIELSAQVVGRCQRSLSALQAYYQQDLVLDIDGGLRRMPSNYWGTGNCRY